MSELKIKLLSMIESKDIETHLYISAISVGIYLFDIKKKKNLYKEELIYKNDEERVNLNILNSFLEDNFFKIEKLLGNFINNINLIIESKNITETYFGIKKKIYDETINIKKLENMLKDVKDLFKDNYRDEKIMHLIINKYIVDGKNYFSFHENLKGENFCLEVKFSSISNSAVLEIEKVLEKFHIKILHYIDGNYIKKMLKKENLEFSDMVYKVKNGFNENEVKFLPKNLKKKGFFEKFFQLFS